MKPVMKLKREAIKKIRDLAKDYHDSYAADELQSLDLLKDKWPDERTKEYFRDPRRIQLKKIIDDLSKNECAELLALVWLGRGDAGVTVKDWDTLVDDGKKFGEGASDYLIAKAPLADYIDKGLAKIDTGKD
jgi:hypothetical protein